MRIVRGVQWMVLGMAVAVASGAGATPFGFIGPRQVGMGGAGVSATEDAHAIYWNPAGLALRDGLDIRLSGTVRASVNQTLDDAIDKIRDAVNGGDGGRVRLRVLRRVQRHRVAAAAQAPQGRASVTAFPIDGMTVSADVDVTPNPTFVKGADSQI